MVDRRDRPVTIELADPPAGWKAGYHDTMGMFEIKVMLDSLLKPGAGRAAVGRRSGHRSGVRAAAARFCGFPPGFWFSEEPFFRRVRRP